MTEHCWVGADAAPGAHRVGMMRSSVPHPQGRSHSLPTQHSPDADAAAKARLILFKLQM